jgi:isoleucyl-tRNA synthetase
MVDIRIISKEGFNVGMQNNHFIILNTTLNQDLIDEGIVRELISKVQNLRKTSNFDVCDRINIYYNGEEDFVNAMNKHIDLIKSETLCIDLIKKEDLTESYDLNGYNVYINVKKI